MPTQSQPAAVRAVLLVTVGAAFLSSLDLFVVNVAFDEIGRDLGVGSPGGPTAGDLSWVLNAYAVVVAALLVPFGRLADRYGRRRLFLLGVAVFTLASAACALSGDVWVLVGFRAAQAVGAAAMTPTSLGILLAALPPERRLVGVRVWAAVGAVAAAIGPTVGGLLTELSWRWVFLINVPVGVAMLLVAVRAVADDRVADDAPTPDLVGAALVAGSAGLLALGLVKSHEWGWSAGATWAALAGAVVLALAFARRSARHHTPVIDPALLRVRTFRWSVLAMLLFNVSFAANLLVGVLWLQQVWGYGVLRAGLAVAVGPLLVPLTAAVVQRVLPTASPSRLVTAGSLVCALGCLVAAAGMGESPAYATAYLPAWVVGGIGVGLALPNLMAGSTHDLPPSMAATGSGVVTMARQLGFVVGVSVLFALVGDAVGVPAVDGFRQTWVVAAVVLVAAAAAATGMRTRATRPGAVPVG
ncbi:MFS transporter [Nocardioides sp. SYSU D00038]|uniref:MFS transporter n=1 Tax=Nocardioides sp. SYSU D00038 TaxID=2812554 RepID=UPI001967B6D4|nr:MFS transporter [Nocardioides sp. SYSU D00038]